MLQDIQTTTIDVNVWNALIFIVSSLIAILLGVIAWYAKGQFEKVSSMSIDIATMRENGKDNFDLGLKYKKDGILYNPNIFVTKVSGKQASLYDPSVGIAYPSNNSDALSYGAELSISGKATDSIDFLVSGSYNKYYFTDDMRTAANTVVSTKGNQIPDAPEYMAKAALTYKLANWSFTPSVKYTSKRYGDVENIQSIPSYTVADLDISYTKKGLFGAKEGVFRLSLQTEVDT